MVSEETWRTKMLWVRTLHFFDWSPLLRIYTGVRVILPVQPGEKIHTHTHTHTHPSFTSPCLRHAPPPSLLTLPLFFLCVMCTHTKNQWGLKEIGFRGLST